MANSTSAPSTDSAPWFEQRSQNSTLKQCHETFRLKTEPRKLTAGPSTVPPQTAEVANMATPLVLE